MLTILYSASYVVSLSGLIGWFYATDNPTLSRRMSKLFLGGFVVYLFSLGFAPAALTDKLLILLRDLVVLGVVSQFFSLFRKYKLIFVLLLAVLYGAIYLRYWDEVLMPSFDNSKPTKISEQGELIIQVRKDVQLADLQEIIQKYGLQYRRAFSNIENENWTRLDDCYLVDIPKNQELLRPIIKKAFLDSGLIDWIEDNEIVEIAPLKGNTKAENRQNYGINDPDLERLWGFSSMNISSLYAFLRSEEFKTPQKALIVILDTGVDATHEDLAANYRSIQPRYDRDYNKHGTHCAGIAAAVSNNGKGIASFSPDNGLVEVASIQVLGSNGSGTQERIIQGIIEAADAGAAVISMSLGGISNDRRQHAYEEAVAYANRKGAVVVVAAGNSNQNAMGYVPANVDGVIAVSAIDSDLKKAEFSNWVTNLKRGIAAPGVNIYSTIPNNQYTSLNGTSMATPYVAGLVGMMKAINPDLTTSEVYQILHQTGKNTADTHQTGKLIQPEAALKELF